MGQMQYGYCGLTCNQVIRGSTPLCVHHMKVYIVLFPGIAQSNDSEQDREVKSFLEVKEACKYLYKLINDFGSDESGEAQIFMKGNKFLELAKLYSESVECCFAKIVKMY